MKQWLYALICAAVIGISGDGVSHVTAQASAPAAKSPTKIPPPAPAINEVPGLKLPASQIVNYDEQFVSLTAVCTGKVRWLVLSTDAKVKFKVNTGAPNEIEVGIPPHECSIAVFAVGLVDGELTEAARTDIFVKGLPGPTPPGPTPPGPNPPDPPDPPHPTASPIPGPGLKVLIIYETADFGNMPAAQKSILVGRPFRDYLNSKCIAEDSGTKAYRIYDKDVKTDNDLKMWQDAMKRPRSADKWIIIGGETTGYEGPLPATVEETTALINKYVGK